MDPQSMKSADSSAELDAQAAAFAQLLSLAPNDLDAAWRQAAALAVDLFPHQVEGVAFLLGRRRAILADDMGLGKTRQAIVALRHISPGGPFLVICPASVKSNWAREIGQVNRGSIVDIIEGHSAIPKVHADWTIINYDILSKYADTLESVDWAGIVFDEAHYVKNHMSARSRLARQLVTCVTTRAAANESKAPAVYLLTGTPLTNRPRDLFVMLQLIGHALGRSFLAFAKRYCAAEKNAYGWKTAGASNLEELTVQLHGVMLRRSKDQVLSLPPKIRTWLIVDVPAGTGGADMRAAVKLLLGREGGEEAGTSLDESNAHAKLLGHLTRARRLLSVAKVGATKDFVTGAVEQGEKVLVFSSFEEPLQRLAKSFGSAAVLLTGSTPFQNRQELVDRFQEDDEVRVFLSNIVAGGVGLNLTAATQVVFNDLDWVPANHWQAEDRAYRIGQMRMVNVTYFVAGGTIDDFVQVVLARKAELIGSVIDGKAIGDLPGDVLDELKRTLRTVSPGLADATASLPDDHIAELLRQATETLRATGISSQSVTTPVRRPEDIEALRQALETLARVLAGPPGQHYRYRSSSKPGVDYTITVDATDVLCSCPGFEYRGQCRHARDVKAALAAGLPIPAAYTPADAAS